MTTVTESLETIMEKIRAGEYDKAHTAINNFQETEENRCELMFFRGYLQELTYDRQEALATYQAVLDQDPDHTEAAFRAALLVNQCGDDDAAIELYQRCINQKPAHINAMINLAVIFEDRGQLSEAEDLLTNIVEDYPHHHRAAHFLKSVESIYTMMYDEKTQEERERYSAVLDAPISDFELSVRSRNCLRQMNIRTLGSLLKTTEAELLAYKNFGETSLCEIKALLTQKGLRLGQALPQPEPFMGHAGSESSDDTFVHASRSIADLELSMRSRKALQQLGVTTLGDLAQQTDTELMAIKNFGQTSMDEIKQQLEKFGLSLQLSEENSPDPPSPSCDQPPPAG